MKQIIGHRGAAGLGLENSVSAIKQALALGTSIIEIDVRLTRDNKLVVCHDVDLVTMAGNTSKIGDHDWSALKGLTLRDGSNLLLLEDVLKLVGKSGLIIEAKDNDCEAAIVSVLDAFPNTKVWVASFRQSLLENLRRLRPKLPLYYLEHTKWLEAIQVAKRYKLQGIGLNFWLLNPFGYFQARRAGLDVYLYTVNSRFLAWFLHILYPRASICTDYPDRLVKRRSI
ncbi:MAG: glycerophosphodiester phosphodiesterase [Candidatus Saccharibacteria bacterium]